jgi:hypothetical protein
MNQDPAPPTAHRFALPVAVLAGLIGITGLIWIMSDVWLRANAMQPAATPAAAVIGAPEGSIIETVARLREPTAAGAYTAELLERIDDTTYRATGKTIRLALAPETKVVMGAASDVNPGAVVQLKGTLDANRVVHANRVVILTDFVKVSAG